MSIVFRRIHIRATFLLFLFTLFSGFTISACALSYDHATWRYRMTVTVETPEGLKTGSAVREVSAFREPKVFSEQTSGHATLSKGEAVVVDLGKRGVLFALMRGGTSGVDYSYYVVFNAFPFKDGSALSAKGINYYSHLKAGPVELPPSEYPEFVHFKDLSAPKTVEEVSSSNFSAVFGTGVRLKSVSIEMTNAPVTWGIDKWLTWLPDYYSKMFDGQRYNTIGSDYPLANTLESGVFKAGSIK